MTNATQAQENLRFTVFKDVTSHEIVENFRNSNSTGPGDDRYVDFLGQNHLDQTDTRMGSVNWRKVWKVGSTIVVVACVASTAGACTIATFVVAAGNVAISAHDNDIGSGSNGCQKAAFATDALMNSVGFGSSAIGGIHAAAVRRGNSSLSAPFTTTTEMVVASNLPMATLSTPLGEISSLSSGLC